MPAKASDQNKLTYEELLQENLVLRQKIERTQAENQAVWKLLVETNRRLQLSSAAIKASVSSLLNYDIFWDGTNQHEFLETINSSIDQVGKLINLLALIFRVEAGNLELRRELQALPEIISVVQEHVSRRSNNLSLEVVLPRDGKLVLVNYDYLIIAIEFLVEAAGQYGAKKIQIEAVEAPDHWILAFGGMTQPSIQKIQELFRNQDGPLEPNNALAPEYQLRLWLAFHILRQQDIQFEVVDQPAQQERLLLLVPASIGG
jgi:K+-sensing histidine kinase KdpD